MKFWKRCIVYCRLIHLFIFHSEDIWTLLYLMLMCSQLTYEYWWRERFVISYTFISNQELMFAIVIQWTLDLTSVNYPSFASMQGECSFNTSIILNHINCGSPNQKMYEAWNKISLSFSPLFLFSPHSVL